MQTLVVSGRRKGNTVLLHFITFLPLFYKEGAQGGCFSHSSLCNGVIFDLTKAGLNHIKESLFLLCFLHWVFFSHLSLVGVSLILEKWVMHERHLMHSKDYFFPPVHGWFVSGKQPCDL